jgi:hypothetical protein
MLKRSLVAMLAAFMLAGAATRSYRDRCAQTGKRPRSGHRDVHRRTWRYRHIHRHVTRLIASRKAAERSQPSAA